MGCLGLGWASPPNWFTLQLRIGGGTAMIRAIRIDSDRLHPLHPTTIKKKSGTKKKKKTSTPGSPHSTCKRKTSPTKATDRGSVGKAKVWSPKSCWNMLENSGAVVFLLCYVPKSDIVFHSPNCSYTWFSTIEAHHHIASAIEAHRNMFDRWHGDGYPSTGAFASDEGRLPSSWNKQTRLRTFGITIWLWLTVCYGKSTHF